MSSCTLCGLSTPDPPVSDETIDGAYCCQGCLEVARVLGAEEAERLDADSVDEAIVETPATKHATEDRTQSETIDDCDSAYLSVEGMHCSTCETFLESQAQAHPGVADATASYATDTLKISYDPAAVDRRSLPELVSGYGYDAAHRSVEADPDPSGDVEVVKFLIGGGLFGMMTMVWYALFLYPTYFGYEPFVDLGGFDGLYLFTQIWLLTSIVLFYTGYPILRGGYVSLTAGQPNMDLLVSIAALGSYGYSTLAMVLGQTDLYFDVTVAIILVVTAGNYYESRIKRRASDLLSDLTAIQVSEARRVDGTTIPVAAIAPGDTLLVRPGERIPIDGEVVDGVAAIDEALVTGESVPRTKRPGDAVRGGTVVTDRPVTIRAGEDAESTLDRLVELLWEIQSASPGVQRVADKLATVFVPLVLVAAVVATAWTLSTGAGGTAALLVGLTVVIVSCPCALGLATPLAVARGIKTAASHGIVVASTAIFERGTDVDTIAVDKTGTLTSGRMTVSETIGDDPDLVLSVAAALERASPHPIADAIVAAAAEGGPATDDFERVAADGGAAAPRVETQSATVSEDKAAPARAAVTADMDAVELGDRGVHGTVRGADSIDGPVDAAVGHPALFTDWADPNGWLDTAESIQDDGDVAVVVGFEDVVRGVIAVGDEPKPAWDRVLSELAAGDRELVVLTGDDEPATKRFEAHPDVDTVFANVPPEAKAATVERLKSRGQVAMIGDGSNDAPALAAADLGIALATGTKLATDAADVILVDGDITELPFVFSLAANTKRRIAENLGWAFLYNGVAIPLAIVGVLNPLLAALAMGSSSLIVVLNSTLRSLE